MLNVTPGYTFDDLLLVPKHSAIKSRKNIDLSVDLGKGIKLNHPVVSANMRSVSGPTLAAKIASNGGLAVLHRFHDKLEDHLSNYKKALQKTWDIWDNCKHANIAFSVGVQPSDKEIVDTLINEDIYVDDLRRIVCVDVAHGDSLLCANMTEYIAKKYPDVLLIAGNVATAIGAELLYNAGADVIKLNVGNGSLCTTRIKTGNGVPTLTAISNIHEWRVKNNIKDVKLICDGGMRNSGDIIKALIFTDAVMLGNLLAGTDEAPGDIITTEQGTFKQYSGSSTHKTNNIEGVTALTPYKGSVNFIIRDLIQGIQSGCSYQGVSNLNDLKKYPEFISISNAGLIESHPHDVVVK